MNTFRDMQLSYDFQEPDLEQKCHECGITIDGEAEPDNVLCEDCWYKFDCWPEQGGT